MFSLDLSTALPEIFLAACALVLLMLGVFMGEKGTRAVTYLAVLAAAVTGMLVWMQPSAGRMLAFNDLFIVDGFARYMKLLVCAASALCILLAPGYLRRENIERFEFPVLVLLSTLGMLLMVSANDLMSLYLGLELQSLAIYVLASFRRDNRKSTEAGLKYFVLGALSSGMLLYGASLAYGFSGTTGFTALAAVLKAQVAGGAVSVDSIGLTVGLVMISAGVAFKLSAVPFHMWTPDVYEGAPTPVTALFSAGPKVAAFALFIRLLTGPFAELAPQWEQIVWFCSAASMILGALAALWQTNIKRLMAYSSIGHVGYALVGLTAAAVPVAGGAGLNVAGVEAVLVYLAIYLFMTIGTFAIILTMRRSGLAVESIYDLAGLSRTHPLLAFAMAAFMFSMAGIPPLAGFFSKLWVFWAAMQSHLYVLGVLGVLTSVVGAYYYLRIVKVMYADEPAAVPLDRVKDGELRVVATLCAAAVLLFIFQPGLVYEPAHLAARALLP